MAAVLPCVCSSLVRRAQEIKGGFGRSPMKPVPIPDVHLERIGLSSSAREVGDTIFLAGHTAIDNNGAVVFPGDPVAQCRYTLDALERTLKTLASSLRDLVKITVYVTDVRYRQE